MTSLTLGKSAAAHVAVAVVLLLVSAVIAMRAGRYEAVASSAVVLLLGVPNRCTVVSVVGQSVALLFLVTTIAVPAAFANASPLNRSMLLPVTGEIIVSENCPASADATSLGRLAG